VCYKKTKWFVDIDIYTKHVVIGAIDPHQDVLLFPWKITNQQFGW
jgi:hypothetical protein